ncbi:hypothetical protein F4825DRAFT_273079 [Nemania diffusa]|nr:hypothetical protein F4825DRAFT_273079 [Nemania diffusa]
MDKCQELEQIATNTAGAATSSSASNQKHSTKRVITAARKEQNKLAQRAYRRRQKEQKRVQTLSISSRSRRLEPRQDVIEASVSCATHSSSTSRRLTADSLCFPPQDAEAQDAETLVASSPDVIDLAEVCRQLVSDHLPPSSASQNEVTTVSSIPVATTQLDENVHPPALIALARGLRGSLEDNSTALFRACLSNAICIGIDLTELIYCERPCMSPFYRPTAHMHEDPAALIAASSHDSLPASLKPTLAQILIPHHASFDLIPLPRLRDRAILMCAALPHIFSLWEMKLDIYTRNALVCQTRDTPSGSVSQPWDARSWRAAPWFLSKWKMVVDAGDVETSLALPGIPGLWM